MKNKGFTLVELLAVIVILAIIMIIAIPAVLNTMDSARRKSFIEFANKAILKAEEKYTLRNLEGLPVSGVIVYDIVNDLDLSNTGDYKGYVIVDATESSNKGLYIYLYDKTFLLNLIKSTDLNTEDIENINGMEPINNIEGIIDITGYDSYYIANSPVVNETVNGKYEFLNSLELDGHKYINTNVIPNDNIEIELELINNEFEGIIGSRTAYKSNDSYSIFGAFSNSNVNYIIYWEDVSVSLNQKITSIDVPYKVIYNKKNIKINDTIFSTLSPKANINGKYSMYLFAVNNANNPDYRIFKGTFYSCKIYDNNRLIRHFVPAKKKENSEILIYDKVEKKEYPFIIYN